MGGGGQTQGIADLATLGLMVRVLVGILFVRGRAQLTGAATAAV
ncbi:MAG TPA: hypothetical protein VK923_20875 [Euzebyales bacterium]|nr:hypothetical protein [Euzebyales bacterium]